MKKIGMAALFVICIAGFLSFFPIVVQAANTSRTLQPGRVYTFTGQDRRVISHINVAGTGRYQYVAVDGRGNVTGYGFSFGRVSVNGEGVTMITPLAPLSVTFDTSRLTISETEGEVLRQIELADGRTLAIESSGRTNQHIRTNRAASFDIVVTNAAGGVTFLERDVRFPQFNLPAGSEAVLTANGDGLVVYFPAMWYGGTVVTRRLFHPALYTHEVWEGTTYVFTNTGERNITMMAEPFFAAATFSHDFILRDRQGFAVNHGEATSNRVTLEPRRPLTLTPHMDAELFFPYALLRDIRIGAGTDTPAYHSLEPGETLRITNTDPINGYAVFLLSERDGYPIVYDRTLETEEGITFRVQDNAGTFSIPPGGVLTVTAGSPPEWAPQTLIVRFPESDAISLKAAEPTLSHYIMEAGESLIFTNEGNDDLILWAMAEADTMLEFVMTGPDGEIRSFNRMDADAPIVLLSGFGIHLTHSDGEEPINIHFPTVWLEEGLSIEKTTAQALTRYIVKAGESLRFDNVDNRYNRMMAIQSADGSPVEYDFVHTDNRNNILDYGTSVTRVITLRYLSRITLMPVDEDMYVLYPAVWRQQSFRTAIAPDPVLHRITLRPNERLVITNNRSTAFQLSNNSSPAGAGYFIREGREEHPAIPAGEIAENGPIGIAPHTTVTVTAARGEVLEIWMPFSMARLLRLV
ncbi:MAG: hypothetical protein FWE90_09785 [Defluviitaleaceae bacterium]|nr:hypothetical protein [Defluviitaleaceae bacterium]